MILIVFIQLIISHTLRQKEEEKWSKECVNINIMKISMIMTMKNLI